MVIQLPPGYTSINSRCQITADTGFTCPLMYTDNTLCIKPYFMMDVEDQKIVTQHLRKQWGIYTHEYIDKELSYGDMLYVAWNENGFIGTVAIDRKQFTPFIGTLYVSDTLRNLGYSKILMTFAETYVHKVLGFNEASLWCNEFMLDYYFPLGYTIQSKEKDIYILFKKMI